MESIWICKLNRNIFWIALGKSYLFIRVQYQFFFWKKKAICNVGLTFSYFFYKNKRKFYSLFFEFGVMSSIMISSQTFIKVNNGGVGRKGLEPSIAHCY